METITHADALRIAYLLTKVAMSLPLTEAERKEAETLAQTFRKG